MKPSELRGDDLLRHVRDIILAEPDAFHMAEWFHLAGEDGHGNMPQCKSTHCIAGDAICVVEELRSLYGRTYYNIMEDATGYLGLSDYEAMKLFLHSDWPEPFREEYGEALGWERDPSSHCPSDEWDVHSDGTTHPADYRKAAKVAAARIDHFLLHRR